MRLKKDSSEQKLRGAYYTPLQLANAMVSLVASQNIANVLEPSCGDGVFLDSLASLNLLDGIPDVTAVEIAAIAETIAVVIVHIFFCAHSGSTIVITRCI